MPFRGKPVKHLPSVKIVLSAVMTALALALSYLETLIPYSALIPVPGMKLGLANIVTLLCVFYLGALPAFAVVIVRCFLSAMLFSGFTAFAFSITGGLLACAVQLLLKAGVPKVFSPYGVSMAGGVAHNTGQILAACIILQSTAIFAYYPLLVLSGAAAGLVTAAIAIPSFTAVFSKRTLQRLLDD